MSSYADRIFAQARAGTDINPAGLPLDLAELVVAQARHETADFTSRIFREQNNAFGYSYSGSRYQVGGGAIADNGLQSAIYPTPENSVKEIVDWIYRRRNEGVFPNDLSTITTPQLYANLLKRAGFYGDTVANYTAGLLRYSGYDEPITAGVNWLLVLLGAGVALNYIFRK